MRNKNGITIGKPVCDIFISPHLRWTGAEGLI